MIGLIYPNFEAICFLNSLAVRKREEGN